MSANIKIDIKIGDHEFSAEGPEEIIKTLFLDFKGLIENSVATAQARGDADDKNETNSKSARRKVDFTEEELSMVFHENVKNKFVSLRMRPNVASPTDYILLILLGHKLLRNEDEVLVTKIKSALSESGIPIGRIDRATARYIRDGHLMKYGKPGPGGLYRLTNKGYARAVEITGEMLSAIG